MKQSRRKFTAAVIIQLIVLSICIFAIILKARNPYTLKVDMDACEGSAYFDGSDGSTVDVTDILRTPAFPLKAGSYTLIIDHYASQDQMFRILDDDYSEWISYPTGYLRRGNTRTDYDFKIGRDLANVRVTVQYIPTGGIIDIHEIKIVSSCRPLMKWPVMFFVLFICIDLAYIYRNRLFSRKNTVLALSGLVLITSLPLSISGIDGMDLPYSLLRVEGLYKTLLGGQFPARVNAFILDGAGYAGSVFYGDIFLYPAALLRMTGFNVTETWKILVFLINTATALTAYFSFRGISRNNKTALIMTFAYCSAPYHLEAIYYRAALGEMTAYIFFPIIAYGLYKIYTTDSDSSDFGRLSTILAFGVSAVLCSHLLSAEMLGILLLILALILYKKTFSRSVLIALLSAVAKTVLISLYYLIPFAEYFLTVPTRISGTVATDIVPIQERGAYLSEFFSLLTFFDKGGRVPFNPDGPGLILIAAFLAGIVMWVHSRADGSLKICLVMSGVAMFIASCLFPWNCLTAHTTLGRLMSQVQHPTRYISYAVIFLTLLLMNVLRGRDDKTIRICLELAICFTIFSLSVFSSEYEGTMTARHPVNSGDLDSLAVGNAEYALSDSDIFKNAYSIASENNKDHVSALTCKGINMTATVDAGEAGADIILPRYNYRHLNAYDESGNMIPKTNGTNNLIQISLPSGYSGNVYLRFAEPISWRIAEFLSLLTLVYLAAVQLRKKM